MAAKIGFIGLGTMGRPMAANLLNAGFAVRVYNRTGSRMEPLLALGAERASSCSDAASGSEFVITMLSDSPVVREAVLGSEGAIHGCASGAVIIDMSTISPSVSVQIADECRQRNVEYLDAPVSGGEKGAIDATLSIMVGGSNSALERSRPVLEAMGSRVTHMGGSGKGQAAKLCNQVVCGLNILAVCEGLALGTSAGLDPDLLLEAISGGAAGSWMLSNLASKMVAGDMTPGFRIALQDKDLRLALESAAEHSTPLLGTALVQQLLKSAEAIGLSDGGTQGLYHVVKSLGGGSSPEPR